jgi:hypothetical protein
VFIQALSGAATFAACLRLFRLYPLAVTSPAPNAGYQSMVLLTRAAGSPRFYILTQVSDDLFVIRPWDGDAGDCQEIRPGEQVSGLTGQVINDGMPLPHDGSLLGWVTDNQITVMLAVHCSQPGAGDGPVRLPDIRVMPMAGTTVLQQWPPFAASPLADGRLWEYVEWGQIVDIVPLVSRSAGIAFWVPAPGRPGRRNVLGEGFVVVRDNLISDDYWLPAGVYMDHWTLREGIQAPLAGDLLSLPGAVDLADQLR